MNLKDTKLNKHTILCHVIVAVFTMLPFFSCSQKPGKIDLQPMPNVILINVDDLGWKDLGFMGSDYYETPNLDQFSKEGMVFTNAYAGAANCSPSRACMISGQYGPRHGIYSVKSSERGDARTRRIIPVKNEDTLADSLFTLAEMFQSKGYVTGIFGKWHLSEDPTLMGFDVNVGGNHRGNPGEGGYFSPYNLEAISDGPKGEYLTDRLADEAICFVEKNQKKPFFLYLPFYTVHGPLMGKPELVEKFKVKGGNKGQDNPVYAAMIYVMDQNVGKLLNTLKDLGLEKSTMVIFTSDNGGIRTISDQYPLRGTKGSYYEGGIRIPLVIRYPDKVPAGTSNDQPVMHMDFYPTLQRLIHAKDKRAHFEDGEDLAPILFERKTMDKRALYWHFPVYIEAYVPGGDQARDPLFRTRPGSAIRMGKWKLHEYFEDGSLELYNLEEDIGEQHNLAGENPEKSQELHQKLKAWRISVHAPVPTKKNPAFDADYEANQRDCLKKD